MALAERACLVAGLAGFSIGCIADSPEVADWTIPVPRDTPVIEYEAITEDDRAGNRIELVRDLVIGNDAVESADYQFQFIDGWKNLAVDHDGNIYVVDSLNYRVQVFDAAGDYLRTLGPRGEGPGEIGRPPRAIAIAGDRVMLGPPSRTQVERWNLAGEFIERTDLSIDPPLVWITRFEGTDAGDLIGSWERTYESDDWRNIIRIGRLGSGDTDQRIYLEHIDPDVPDYLRSESFVGPVAMLGAYRPSFAVDRTGYVYVTGGNEYQILALDVSGEARWALRATGPRPMPTASQQDRILGQLREAGVTAEDRDWFRRAARRRIPIVREWPAIDAMHVDGHGHLYVFPPVPRLPGTYADRPVDVYSSVGEHLFSGSFPASKATISRDAFILGVLTPMLPPVPGWAAARGNHIYTTEQDAESGENVVVRYRLVEPF